MAKILFCMAALIVFSSAAFADGYELIENSNAAVIREAKNAIISTGYPCGKVSNVWNVVQNGKNQPAFKVLCANDGTYQLTVFGDRVFVKIWSGTLVGQ